MNEIISHPVLAIVFVLGILVFVHEFGHFLVGKAFGIGVEIFSIGFGPRLFGFRYGLTQYQFCLLPLGGYVKFAGAIPSEEVPDEFRGKEFFNSSLIGQISTIFAGPLANLILATVVYAFLGSKGIEHPAPIIGQIRHGSPADKAGLLSGDKVTHINGREILSWTDLQEQISASPSKPIDIELLRKDKIFDIQVTPESLMLEDMAGRKQSQGRIGIGYGFLPPIVDLLPGASEAKKVGVHAGWSVTKLSFSDQNFVIHTWDEFEEALQNAYAQKAESLSMEFTDSENKSVQTKTLETSSWWHSEDRYLSSPAHLLGITDSQFTIGKIEDSSLPLKTGDRILSFEGQNLADVYVLFELLQKNEKETVNLKVQREEQILSLNVKLKDIEIQKASGKATIYILPLSFVGELVPPPPVVEKYTDFISDIKFAVRTTYKQSVMLIGIIGGLLIGDVPLKSLGGPILIAKVAEDSAKRGLDTFLTSLALISINLGIINLFPIPALDGGKLVISILEGVFRRRLKPAFIENYHKIGFVMILALIVLVMYNDLSRFWTSILQGFVGTFK